MASRFITDQRGGDLSGLLNRIGDRLTVEGDPARGQGQQRQRGLSVRLKLTLSYVVYLLAAMAMFLGIVYLVIHYLPDGYLFSYEANVAVPRRDELVGAMMGKAFQACGILLGIGVVGGWYLAGAMLRPVSQIYDATQAVEKGDLAKRLRMGGRADEFRRLADSMDLMLDRVQDKIDEQRRFAANASHELRTPQAVINSMLEVAAQKPADVDVPDLTAKLLEVNGRSNRIVESLLALSRAENLHVSPETLDLAEVAEEALGPYRAQIGARGLHLGVVFEAAPLHGDAVMLTQMVSNLIRNAMLYNIAEGGWIWLYTGRDSEGRATLRVENTGPLVPEELAQRLTEPFVRGKDRLSSGPGEEGTGLGLAIVRAIVRAHDGGWLLEARRMGGLVVEATFAADAAQGA